MEKKSILVYNLLYALEKLIYCRIMKGYRGLIKAIGNTQLYNGGKNYYKKLVRNDVRCFSRVK